jgi:hypothetical protein
MKHWQAFLLLFPFFIVGVVNFKGGLAHLQWVNAIGISVLIIWLFLQTQALLNIVPNAYRINPVMYYINAIVIFWIMLASKLIYGGELHFRGIYVLAGVYLTYAIFQFLGFPGRILKSFELDRKAKRRESIGYFFLYLFYPVSIWYIQPQLNKLVKKHQTDLAQAVLDES